MTSQEYNNHCGRCGRRNIITRCPFCPIHKEYIASLKKQEQKKN